MKAAHLKSFLAASLAAGIIVVGGPARVQAGAAPKDVTGEAAKNERDAVYTEAELALSKRLLDQVIARADGIVKTMMSASQEAEAVDQRIARLAEGDEGKRLASKLDELTARDTAKMLISTVADRERLTASVRHAEALAQQLRLQRENVVAGYVPPEAIIGELDELASWCRDARARIRAVNECIEQQLLVVSKDFDVAKAPPLREVLLDFQRREAAARDAARRAGVAKAKAEGEVLITAAEHKAELDTIRQEAEGRIAEAQAEVAKLKTEQDAMLKKQMAEMETRLKQQQDTFEQTLADLKSQLAISRAQRARQDAQTQVVETKGKADAEMILKRQRAASPEVLNQVVAFSTPGYFNPSGPMSAEAKPMSLSALRSVGALERSQKGLNQLLLVGVTKRDTVRPRLGIQTSVRLLSGEKYAALSSIQQCLIEYGDIFVEMGVLSK